MKDKNCKIKQNWTLGGLGIPPRVHFWSIFLKTSDGALRRKISPGEVFLGQSVGGFLLWPLFHNLGVGNWVSWGYESQEVLLCLPDLGLKFLLPVDKYFIACGRLFYRSTNAFLLPVDVLLLVDEILIACGQIHLRNYPYLRPRLPEELSLRGYESGTNWKIRYYY